MSAAQYGKQFPILLRMSNPRGHVELLETIGKGNYGYVYKGKLLKKNNQLAAIKVVFLKEDEIKETLLEMEILESCSHPNITGYMGCFLKGLDLWICMEFCGAGSVDNIYRTLKRQVPESVIASILYESLLALEYIHTKAGLIHRDIKAGNLLLTLDGKVKLADFGVSAQLDTIGGGANTFIGTPYWMAPEVIACDPDSPSAARAPLYNDKSDIWSIGITAIEIAEKNPPLSDIHPMQALHLIAKSDIGFAKPKALSKTFVDFVMNCLIKNPTNRPSATDCLMHPFMEMAATLERDKILSQIVSIVLKIKETKKKGLDVTELDEAGFFSEGILISDSQKLPSSGGNKFAIGTMTKNMFGFNGTPSLPSAQISTPVLAIQASNIKEGEPTLVTSPAFADFPPVINHVSEAAPPVFEPIALTSILSEHCTADFLDGQYILIGCERGLFYLDITKPSQKTPIPIIHDIKFSKLQILHDYNVMIALSGRHSHIRQYSLPSIRKLIMYVEGNSAILVEDSNTTVPIQEVMLGKKSNGDQDPEYKRLHHNDDSSLKDETSLISSWTNDFIKIPDTRDSKTFEVEITESSAFISIILFQGITVFRWAQAPYEKFMKIKSFWVPETPQFVSFALDGLAPTHLYIGYTGELNKVTISDSQVKELPVHKEMKSKGMRKPRWQCLRQIPFSDSKLEQLLRQTSKSGTIAGSRKNAALAMGGPTLARPSHSNVDDRYFLATYDRLTKVVDQKAHPMIGAGVGGWKDGVMWSEPPITQVLRPLQNVISVGQTNVEIVDWKSALLRQRLSLNDPTASFKVLANRHGYTLIGVEKKKKGVMIYWMREKSPPPRPPGELLKRILADAIPKPELTQGNPHKAREYLETKPSAPVTSTAGELSGNLEKLTINSWPDQNHQYPYEQKIHSPTDSSDKSNSSPYETEKTDSSTPSLNTPNPNYRPTSQQYSPFKSESFENSQPKSYGNPNGRSEGIAPSNYHRGNRPPQSNGVPYNSSDYQIPYQPSTSGNMSVNSYHDPQAQYRPQIRPYLQRPPPDPRMYQRPPGQPYLIDPRQQQSHQMNRPSSNRPPPPRSESATTYSHIFGQANPGQVVYQKGPSGMIYAQQVPYSPGRPRPIPQQYQPQQYQPQQYQPPPFQNRAPSQYPYAPRPAPRPAVPPKENQQDSSHQFFSNYEDE